MEFNWLNIFNGIIVVLMLIPSIFYEIKNRKNKPVKMNLALVIIEELGRYACIAFMILPVFIKEFGFNPLELMFLYLACNIILLLMYFIFWSIFFKKENKSNALALAIIPTAIILVTGLSLKHWALVIAALVFGFVHIILTIKRYEDK